MANQEHVEVVKQGAAAIVQWRARNPDTRLDLHGANLRKVDLSGADLSWANLCKVDLSGAYLYGANLREANLYGANLREVDLYGANLYGAYGIWWCGPDVVRGDMLYFVRHSDTIMVRAGCFWGTLEAFAAAVEQTHGDNEYGRYYRAVIGVAKAW